MFLLAAVWFQSAVPLERLFRDTIAVAEEYPGCCHVYDGVISNIGILFWWATAVVSGFAALVLATVSSRSRDTIALSMASIFSGWLALDDLFMLHESVLPLAGLSQPVIYAIYGTIALAYITLSWRVVLSTQPVLLFLAMSMLGASVCVDVLADHDLGALSNWLHANPRAEIFLDDGFKFLGVGFWFSLHLSVAMESLSRLFNTIDLDRPDHVGGKEAKARRS